MSSRFFTVGLVACCAAMAASSSSSRFNPALKHATAAGGTSQLRAYGGRSAQQRTDARAAKFDGALADLSRHAARANPNRVLADLHAMSPAARFKLAADGATALVAIDAVTRGDPQQLKSDLEALGLEHAAVFANDVGGWLPVTQLGAASAVTTVHSLRAAMSRTRTGAVTSQGDFVQQSAALRTSEGLTGSGVTVGVLSDSFNCYATYAVPANGVPASGYQGYAYNGFLATAATDVSTGDLPSGVNVVAEADCLDYGAPAQAPFGDEGRAMLQIVYDVAPGASLAFNTAEPTEADFANGIVALAKAGAKVIADDVGYFDEPFYQDGIVAEAINAVEAPTSSGGYGVAYFSAAGNDGNSANGNAGYENIAPSFATLSSSGANAGEYLLNFDTTGATTSTSLPITVDALPPGDLLALVVEWDQPYFTGAPKSGGATSQIDICVTGTTSVFAIEDYDGNAVTCTGPNALGSDPVQILIIANPANATSTTPQETLNLVIGLAGGTKAPGRIKVVAQSDGQSDPPLTQFSTNSSTLQGHPSAAGAAAIGAAFYFDTPACGTTPAEIESFSSSGGSATTAGTEILFDSTGTRLATPELRQKPNVVGPDGGNDTFLGFTLASDGVTDGKLQTDISACQNNPAYPNFFGTSAATPHVAGIAALILQANSTVTPTQIYTALENSALPMGGASGYNVDSGFGFVQAQAALALIPPGAPTLTLGKPSIASGSSTTITWSATNATSCVASGSWTGTLAASGAQNLTPTTTGMDTYNLSCSNAAGTSTTSIVSLTVTPPPPSAPTLTLAATTVVAGSSTTITWSSANATSCTASGSWSGALATSGSQTVTPTAAGTATYSLICANSGGNSASSSVSLTVTAPPSSGGGGGSLEWQLILALAGLSFARCSARSGHPLIAKH